MSSIVEVKWVNLTQDSADFVVSELKIYINIQSTHTHTKIFRSVTTSDKNFQFAGLIKQKCGH